MRSANSAAVPPVGASVAFEDVAALPLPHGEAHPVRFALRGVVMHREECRERRRLCRGQHELAQVFKALLHPVKQCGKLLGRRGAGLEPPAAGRAAFPDIFGLEDVVQCVQQFEFGRFAVAPPDVVRTLDKVRDSYNVSRPAQAGGAAALRPRERPPVRTLPLRPRQQAEECPERTGVPVAPPRSSLRTSCRRLHLAQPFPRGAAPQDGHGARYAVRRAAQFRT